MKVLPVYPEFPISFWSYRYALDLMRKNATMPPTGLATVAAMLPQEHFELEKIIDLNVEPLTDAQIKKSDIIFTSSMIVQKDSLEEIIDRAHHFGKKVVAGGPYPTSYAEDLEKFDNVHLVLGEAEDTLTPFVNDLFSGNAKRVYETSGKKPSITSTPVPRWDLLNLNKYFSMAIQYSRGCPYDCEFCDITKLYGKESRTKTPKQMINEFEALRRSGWRGPVFIVDDNFIGNKKNVREMLPVVKQWQKRNRFPFSFYTEASMELANPNHKDILEGMVDAGFDMVFMGIESVDPDVIKKMQKGQNLGKLNPYQKVEVIQRAGLEVTAGFIIGSDGEKPEVFENLFNFIQKSGIVVPMAGLLTALKGTDLYKRLKKEGRLREESTGNNTHHFGFNFKTELDENFLINNYGKLLKRLFKSEKFYERCRVLDSRRGEYHMQDRLDRAGIGAFFRIMYQNLIRSPDKEFIKYMKEVALTRPSKLSEAVAYAVKLHHFKTMTDGTLDVREYNAHARELYETFREKVEQFKKKSGIKIDEILGLEMEIMCAARKRYDKLHDDFKEGAKNALNWLEQMIESEKGVLALS